MSSNICHSFRSKRFLYKYFQIKNDLFSGKLPVWLINRVTKVVAPKALKKLHKACLNYPAWKNKHDAQWKPWIYPHQLVT